MKIAAVSNNGKSISAHFGKARYFVVVTVEEGKITGQEIIDREAADEKADVAPTGRVLSVLNNPSHGHHGDHDTRRHNIEEIAGCDLVFSRGMGMGMINRLQQAGLKPILTDIMDIEQAVYAYLNGTLVEHPELVH